MAERLEVTGTTIYTWWNQHLIDTGRRPGISSTDNTELIAARKRIAQLEDELAATKRANGAAQVGGAPKGGTRPSQ